MAIIMVIVILTFMYLQKCKEKERQKKKKEYDIRYTEWLKYLGKYNNREVEEQIKYYLFFGKTDKEKNQLIQEELRGIFKESDERLVGYEFAWQNNINLVLLLFCIKRGVIPFMAGDTIWIENYILEKGYRFNKILLKEDDEIYEFRERIASWINSTLESHEIFAKLQKCKRLNEYKSDPYYKFVKIET